MKRVEFYLTQLFVIFLVGRRSIPAAQEQEEGEAGRWWKGLLPQGDRLERRGKESQGVRVHEHASNRSLIYSPDLEGVFLVVVPRRPRAHSQEEEVGGQREVSDRPPVVSRSSTTYFHIY